MATLSGLARTLPRVLSLCLVLWLTLWRSAAGRAATPPSGSISPGSTVSWDFAAVSGVNPDVQHICLPGNCDSYDLSVVLPNGAPIFYQTNTATLTIKYTWTSTHPTNMDIVAISPQGAASGPGSPDATSTGSGEEDLTITDPIDGLWHIRSVAALAPLPTAAHAVATLTAAPRTKATPTLVQHVASSVNPLGIGIPGNDFKFTLPNAVLAGNCLILELAFCSTRNVNCDHPGNDLAATPVTDNNGNRWPTTPSLRSSDSNSGIDIAIFVLPNANAGVTTITVHFTQMLRPVQYTISEFYNIATASPVNGSSTNSAGASPNLTAGSLTPGNNDANGGNLILTYIYDTSGPPSGNTATNIAAGPNFTLLDADIAWATDTNDGYHASEYFVQTTAAPINPAMTVTMIPGHDIYNVAAIALKAALAGTAPAAKGIRIVRIIHQTNEVPPTTGWKLQFPSSGNLIVFVTNENSPIINITSVTDNKGNTYTKVEDDPSEPQFWYAANATTDPNLTLTLNVSGRPAGATVVLYDIVGAATTSPLDGHQGVPTQVDNGGANISNSPSITPASANGLTIASAVLGTGPSSGLNTGSPPGAIFDLVYYTGETDLDTMDNADCKAHVYNTDLAQENWNWVVANGGKTTNYASMAVHFHAQ
jgi:hypothetical protein